MGDGMICVLCDASLGGDFTILGSSNYIETLSFLKGCQIEEKQCKVCLICFEKINFISSFRAPTSARTVPSENQEVDKAKETNDSDDNELGDLCTFYAESDFRFDSSEEEDHRDTKIPGDTNKETSERRFRLRKTASKCSEISCRPSARRRTSDFLVRCPHPDCKRTFTRGGSGNKLKSHLKKFHNPANKDDISKIYKYECSKCYALFKSSQTLKCHEDLKHSNSTVKKVQCPHCNYQVLASRKTELYRNHIRSVHPEFKDLVEKHQIKLANWKADLAVRAKIQCILCSFAGVKISNMHRHYTLVHGYDKTLAEKNSRPDPDHPDGALCPQCGEHFINRDTLIKHLLKIHSKITGEQCIYCSFRYHDIMDHIERSHKDEREGDVQVCKKCQPEKLLTSFQELLSHIRTVHRKTSEAFGGKSPSINCNKEKRIKRFKSDISNSESVSKSSKKKYVPVHLAGICPFCELKFSDLLGHLRHNHEEEKGGEKKDCQLCGEIFPSIRELVSHRQLHPRFKSHSCHKCSSEFETVVQLRNHRKECPKYKRKRRITVVQQSSSTSAVLEVNAVVANQVATSINNASCTAALSTLMSMANDLDETELSENSVRPKNIELEGRGSVPCHICSKTFTLKSLLRRHYISHHSYDPIQASELSSPSKCIEPNISCQDCRIEFSNVHGRIRHRLELHATISGQICPYCDSKWGWKKFDHLDEHVSKYHVLEMQSPVQTCSTCKTNFVSYEELKVHRQLHEGGNRKLTLVVSQESVSVHPMVSAQPEIQNRGGVKCQLCNAFKLRKDHLKLHYIKHHGYLPKLGNKSAGESTASAPCTDLFVDGEDLLECSSCTTQKFSNQHLLIKHLLKDHCSYTGIICPYCRGAFPQRFIDLQSHVTSKHMDQLTGYNVCNRCQVCSKSFTGYAELRDHVQVHGDAYKEQSQPSPEKAADKKKSR